MRGTVLLLMLGVVTSAAPAEPVGLTFEDIVQRSLVDPQRLERTAELARLERDVASTGPFTREGPTLQAEVGPRKIESGATKLDAVARVEVALLSGKRTRSDADRLLREASPDVLAAEAVESRLRLRIAYLDAWLAQERLVLLEAQAAATEQIVASVRKRVDAGAEAPYEIALVEGEILRLGSDSDGARAELGGAWARLRAAADLPVDPQAVASPGPPDLVIPDDAPSRFEAGALSRAASRRLTLQSSFVNFEQAQRGLRWALAGTLGKEGDEEFATIGAAYRFPARGEVAAMRRDREATVAALGRTAEAASARIESLFAATLARVRHFGRTVRPEAFDDALAAVGLRMELGKDRPSQALPVRRQILESQGAALQRIRDAHVLMAELNAMTAGDAP